MSERKGRGLFILYTHTHKILDTHIRIIVSVEAKCWVVVASSKRGRKVLSAGARAGAHSLIRLPANSTGNIVTNYSYIFCRRTSVGERKPYDAAEKEDDESGVGSGGGWYRSRRWRMRWRFSVEESLKIKKLVLATSKSSEQLTRGKSVKM